MNKVILMGRIVRDPDVRYTQGAEPMCVARYTLAVDRIRRANGQNEADFINCIAFGKAAEFAEKFLVQGTKIVISGRIQTGSYTNKEGQKVYTTDVVIETQEFAESKAASENRSNGSGSSYGGGYGNNGNSGSYNGGGRQADYFSSVGEGFMNIPDGVEDIGLPFN